MKTASPIPAALACMLLTAAPLSLAAEAGDPAAGKGKTSMCIGCQHAAYIVKALQEYKSGNRSHPSMRAIEDLAAYYSTQKGLVVKY